MGASPTANIEITVPFETAERIATELIDHFGYTVFEQSEGSESFRYKLNWPETVETGEDAELQKLTLLWSTGQNEYTGVGSGEKLVIHYGSYYHEDSLSRFNAKLDVLNEILEWVQTEYPDVEVEHYVAISTT